MPVRIEQARAVDLHPQSSQAKFARALQRRCQPLVHLRRPGQRFGEVGRGLGRQPDQCAVGKDLCSRSYRVVVAMYLHGQYKSGEWNALSRGSPLPSYCHIPSCLPYWTQERRGSPR